MFIPRCETVHELIQTHPNSYVWGVSISDRTGTLEAQVQETEHIKMENVELKCQLEESEKKLTLCQQEIQVTSDQLGRLEMLACKIESKEKITANYDGEELVQLR